MSVERMYFADGWHCGTQGCGCWEKPVDIERDKDYLKKLFGRYNDTVEVSYSEYTEEEGEDKGKLHKQYNVTVGDQYRDILEKGEEPGIANIYTPLIFEAAWHGFMLTGIFASIGKFGHRHTPIQHLTFERIGIWRNENCRRCGCEFRKDDLDENSICGSCAEEINREAAADRAEAVREAYD